MSDVSYLAMHIKIKREEILVWQNHPLVKQEGRGQGTTFERMA